MIYSLSTTQPPQWIQAFDQLSFCDSLCALSTQSVDLFQHGGTMRTDADGNVISQALVIEHQQRLAIQVRRRPARRIVRRKGESLVEPQHHLRGTCVR